MNKERVKIIPNVKKIILWKWQKEGYRSMFDANSVNMAYRMIKRHVQGEYQVICITDTEAGIMPEVAVLPLWVNPAPHYGGHTRPNCFFRLKAFSEGFGDLIEADSFIWFDLDMMIVKDITDLVFSGQEFKIWRVDNERMPCNGSMVSMKVGARSRVWDTFKPKDVHPVSGFRRETGMVGSDQAWIAHNLQEDDQFYTMKDGVYSYRCHLLKEDRYKHILPNNARIIFFHGDYHPWEERLQRKSSWIREHYRKLPDER